MKKDLATAFIAAIAGVLIAYFVTNIFIPPISNFTYSTVNSTGSDYVDPNIEIFNFRALNPTVEVFVGNCTEYDENGECVEDAATDELPEKEPEAPVEETPEETPSESPEVPNEAPAETPSEEPSTEENSPEADKKE